ncbi:hypothetical protein H5P28_15645 [Ruficoccus amylovorans]|uniref:SLA1 homology domain-containing protein n=1 Tax=Ruficoccus amylovorans TaxID=1804625 RepID=A0A842HKM9_9BACT|nr:hypothetical protein [Ruficoccus amylovorans]MBC2595701.1 hypothetical protein [Ruficoccus amylovorans]
MGQTAFARLWTSSDGRTLEADYVGADAYAVTVQRALDGVQFQIPLDRLSEEDRAFVETRLSEKNTSGTSSQPPAANARGPLKTVSVLGPNAGDAAFRDFDNGLNWADGLLFKTDITPATLAYGERWLKYGSDRMGIRQLNAILVSPDEIAGLNGQLIVTTPGTRLKEDYLFATGNMPLYVESTDGIEAEGWLLVVANESDSPNFARTELMKVRSVNAALGRVDVERFSNIPQHYEWRNGDWIMRVPNFGNGNTGPLLLLNPDSEEAVDFAVQRVERLITGRAGEIIWKYVILNHNNALANVANAINNGLAVDLNNDGEADIRPVVMAKAADLLARIARGLEARGGENITVLTTLDEHPAQGILEGGTTGIYFSDNNNNNGPKNPHHFSSWLNSLAYLGPQTSVRVFAPSDSIGSALSVFFADDIVLNGKAALTRNEILYHAGDSKFDWLGLPKGPVEHLAQPLGTLQPLDAEFVTVGPGVSATREGDAWTIEGTEGRPTSFRLSLPAQETPDLLLTLAANTTAEGYLTVSLAPRQQPFHPTPYATGWITENGAKYFYPGDESYNATSAYNARTLRTYSWRVHPKKQGSFIDLYLAVPQETPSLVFAWRGAEGTTGTVALVSETGETGEPILQKELIPDGPAKKIFSKIDLTEYAEQMIRLRFTVNGPESEPPATLTSLSNLKLTSDDSSRELSPFPRSLLESPVNANTGEISFYFSDLPPSAPFELEFTWHGSTPLILKNLHRADKDVIAYRLFEHGICLINPSSKPYPLDLAKAFPKKKFAYASGSNSGSRVYGSIPLPAASAAVYELD